MTLSLVDVFGNIISIVILATHPVTDWLSRVLLERKATKDGNKPNDIRRLKAYSRYTGFVSVLFTSALFTAGNMVYLLFIAGLQWLYISYGLVLLTLLSGVGVMYALLDPYSIRLPLREIRRDLGVLSRVPGLPRVTPTQILLTVSLAVYIFPVGLVLLG